MMPLVATGSLYGELTISEPAGGTSPDDRLFGARSARFLKDFYEFTPENLKNFVLAPKIWWLATRGPKL